MRSKSKVILFTVVLLFITFNSTAFTGVGSGTPLDPYKIENVEHLQSISQEPGAYYVLANDIDASARGFDQGFTPIEPFSGTLNGKGHEIENLKIIKKDGSLWNIDRIGLFQSISENGKVKNLGIKNSEIQVKEVGSHEIGTLAGLIGGNISRVYVSDGLISVDNADVFSVGGISGNLEGGQKPSIRNSYVTGKIQGGSHAGAVGGLTGLADQNYYGEKHMIANNYVGSYVTGGESLGVLFGAVGENSLRSFGNYYDKDSNPGTSAVGKGSYVGEGLSSSAMTDKSNFKNWDFENVWKMGEEGPELRGITGEADNPPELPGEETDDTGGDGDDGGDSEGGSESSDTITALRDTIDQLNSTVQSLRQENQELRAQLEQDSSGSGDSQKVSELEEENQQLRETNNQLEERVAELESQVDDSGGDSGSDSSGAFNDLLDLILR